nr:hypothetical protein CFP56_36261 [Quercus suber]
MREFRCPARWAVDREIIPLCRCSSTTLMVSESTREQTDGLLINCFACLRLSAGRDALHGHREWSNAGTLTTALESCGDGMYQRVDESMRRRFHLLRFRLCFKVITFKVQTPCIYGSK